MSIGNVTQSLNFSSSDLVLVLGENLDLGGNDNRNGVGKSTIVNALSYALYGAALTNIKKDNLINKSNMKHMLVTLTFEINGIDYKIERGRKPGIFKFIKNGVEKESNDDESQGEGRHTQEEIVRLIGVTHDMFKHIAIILHCNARFDFESGQIIFIKHQQCKIWLQEDCLNFSIFRP